MLSNTGRARSDLLRRVFEIDGLHCARCGGAAARAAHDARGLDIDAATAAPRWDGEPVDYGLAVEALLAAASCG